MKGKSFEEILREFNTDFNLSQKVDLVDLVDDIKETSFRVDYLALEFESSVLEIVLEKLKESGLTKCTKLVTEKKGELYRVRTRNTYCKGSGFGFLLNRPGSFIVLKIPGSSSHDIYFNLISNGFNEWMKEHAVNWNRMDLRMSNSMSPSEINKSKLFETIKTLYPTAKITNSDTGITAEIFKESKKRFYRVYYKLEEEELVFEIEFLDKYLKVENFNKTDADLIVMFEKEWKGLNIELRENKSFVFIRKFLKDSIKDSIKDSNSSSSISSISSSVSLKLAKSQMIDKQEIFLGEDVIDLTR